uniref:Uncharacterized protein n=1 Tax=Oryza barthii TaxID=65489 RepID=A0A0D3F0P9_9ORYZ
MDGVRVGGEEMAHPAAAPHPTCADLAALGRVRCGCGRHDSGSSVDLARRERECQEGPPAAPKASTGGSGSGRQERQGSYSLAELFLSWPNSKNLSEMEELDLSQLAITIIRPAMTSPYCMPLKMMVPNPTLVLALFLQAVTAQLAPANTSAQNTQKKTEIMDERRRHSTLSAETDSKT